MKLNGAVGERISLSDQTNESAHIQGIRSVCFPPQWWRQRRSVQWKMHASSGLPSMPRPSGLSRVNRSTGYVKHASHPLAHVHSPAPSRAPWFIRVHITDVRKPPLRRNPFTQTRAHSERKASGAKVSHAHTVSRCFSKRRRRVYHMLTHMPCGYSVTCGTESVRVHASSASLLKAPPQAPLCFPFQARPH